MGFKCEKCGRSYAPEFEEERLSVCCNRQICQVCAPRRICPQHEAMLDPNDRVKFYLIEMTYKLIRAEKDRKIIYPLLDAVVFIASDLAIVIKDINWIISVDIILLAIAMLLRIVLNQFLVINKYDPQGYLKKKDVLKGYDFSKA